MARDAGFKLALGSAFTCGQRERGSCSLYIGANLLFRAVALLFFVCEFEAVEEYVRKQ